MTKAYGLDIDYERDNLFNDFSKILLKDFYMIEGETSPQEAFARAAIAYCDGDIEFAQKIYDYASRQWFTFSSPTLSNAPKPGEPWKAMPISCFLMEVPDTVVGLVDHSSELRWLSVKGGGIGSDWSSVRPSSKKAPGPIPFLRTVDADMIAYKQGSTRKGSYAAYMSVSHPDIVEFIQMKLPTGGDINRKCLNLFNAVNIPDSFMEAVFTDSDWNLVDPSNGEIREVVKARTIYELILETRMRTGGPFMFHIDIANDALPECQKALGGRIHCSNLCTEIVEINGRIPGEPFDRTAVCALASLNAAKFEEWENTDLVKVLVRLLDNVIEQFVQNAPKELENAVWSASQERSIGIGVLGFHDLLQKRNIPFESALAVGLNRRLFSFIQKESEEESIHLAQVKGSCPDAEKFGLVMRNVLKVAIAPNANSAIFVNASPSCEIRKSNAFTHRTRAGSFLVKNPALEILISSFGLTEAEEELLWNDIVVNQGSIAHMHDWFTEWQRDVFKTAFEIDQNWVIQHAADRQEYIDQAQSVNLFFPAKTDRNYLLQVHLKAWKTKLKTLYYCRTESSVQADKISLKIARRPLSAILDEGDCLACQA